MPGAVDTTYTFTATDTITSTKMNNIIDQTVMTSESCLSGGGLEVASGKLTISANAINSSRLAANSVSSSNIVDGTIVNADISPTAAIAGTKIVSQFGTQDITAAGDIGLEGTASDYTVVTCNNTSGVQVQLNANGNTEGNVRTTTNHPLTLSTNNTERMRIAADGNVGIGVTSPNYKLHVYNGDAAIINPASNALVIVGEGTGADQYGYLSWNRTNNTLSVGTQNNPIIFGSDSSEWMRLTTSGNLGIGKSAPTTKLDVNGTVTATAFAGQLFGQADSAITVSNGAITAAKLDGAQSGSPPIFGVRAWANIDGTVGSVSVRQGGNVSGVVRNQLGRYTITFTTPMQDTNYAIVAWARDANATDNNYFVSAASNATKLAGSFQIEVNSPGGTVDSPEIGVMVIR